MVNKRRAAYRRAVSEEPEELAGDNRRSLNLEKESEDVRKLLAALNVSKERQKGTFARKIDSLWKVSICHAKTRSELTTDSRLTRL